MPLHGGFVFDEWLQFVLWRWRAATPARGATRNRLLVAADLLVEADAVARQDLSGGLLRRVSAAAVCGVVFASLTNQRQQQIVLVGSK